MSGLADAAFSILMIGHSLFGPTGPDMLEDSLRDAGARVQMQSQIINGAPLRYNWGHSDTAYATDARVVLPQGEITHLIMTEALPLDNHLVGSETGVFASAFADLAIKANPDVKIYVQETWHSLLSGSGQTVPYDQGASVPWRQRLVDDLPKWEAVVEEIRTTLPQADVALIPAGQAFARLNDEIEAGDIPQLSNISQLFADDIHQNYIGHYFVSMVQFATVTGHDPRGITHRLKDRYGGTFYGPDQELAAQLQRVAWEAVVAYAGIVPQVEGQNLQTPKVVLTDSDPPKNQNPSPAKGPKSMAVGLAGVADWGTQQPFLDIMKTARPLFGHMHGRWGGYEHERLQAEGHLDADGWPLRKPGELGSIATIILTEIPVENVSMAGRYVAMFDGTGILEISGRVSNVRYAKNKVMFDYAPGPGMVDVRIQRTQPSDPLRNIRIVREDRLQMYQDGAIFNPDYIERIRNFGAIRLLNWIITDGPAQSSWGDRPKISDATWAHTGVPLEVIVALVNEADLDAWVNIPHLANDEYVRAFAEFFKERVGPRQKIYAEFSNEVWNWQFPQTAWADAQADARWGLPHGGNQYYAFRAAQIARIFSDVYGDEADTRLVNVISSQTGWLGLEVDILNGPLIVAEGGRPPAEAFDAYAITGYFAGVLGFPEYGGMVKDWIRVSLEKAQVAATQEGLTGQAKQDRIMATRYDYATHLAAQELLDGAISGNQSNTLEELKTRIWPYHLDVARRHGLDLVMYEGGTHVVGLEEQLEDQELTDFFAHLNYSAEMGLLHKELFRNWDEIGGQLFNVYMDVYVPSKWGSWGTLRHLDDDNPRWDAVMATR